MASALTVDELRRRLETLGLSTHGARDQLRSRLRKHRARCRRGDGGGGGSSSDIPADGGRATHHDTHHPQRTSATPPAAPPPSEMPSWTPRIDSYLVLDIEATCERGPPDQPRARAFDYPNEIIELPVVLLQWRRTASRRGGQDDDGYGDDDARVRARQRLQPQPQPQQQRSEGGWELFTVDTFHTYVRPTWRPRLTRFARQLTGITQATVDAAPTWPEAVALLAEFLARHGLLEGVVPGDDEDEDEDDDDSEGERFDAGVAGSGKQGRVRKTGGTDSAQGSAAPTPSADPSEGPRPRRGRRRRRQPNVVPSSTPLRRGVSWLTHGPHDLADFVVKQAFISGGRCARRGGGVSGREEGDEVGGDGAAKVGEADGDADTDADSGDDDDDEDDDDDDAEEDGVPPAFLRGPIVDVKRSVLGWMRESAPAPPAAPQPARSHAGPTSTPTPTPAAAGAPRDMTVDGLLSYLGLAAFEGRAHSGLDDARNIARLLVELAARVASAAADAEAGAEARGEGSAEEGNEADCKGAEGGVEGRTDLGRRVGERPPPTAPRAHQRHQEQQQQPPRPRPQRHPQRQAPRSERWLALERARRLERACLLPNRRSTPVVSVAHFSAVEAAAVGTGEGASAKVAADDEETTTTTTTTRAMRMTSKTCSVPRRWPWMGARPGEVRWSEAAEASSSSSAGSSAGGDEDEG